MNAARLALLNLGAGICALFALALQDPWWLLGVAWFTVMVCLQESKR